MILDNPNRRWVYVIPSKPGIWFPHYQGRRITREEYFEHWGKWIVVDDKERLDELAYRLDPAVESRQIYMIKYLRSAPALADFDKPIMCIYCDDRERGEILQLLLSFGAMPYGWEYDRDMYEHWKPGGEFLERWISLQNLSPEEAERARQECVREREAWLEYFFVRKERMGRLKQCAPIWSPEDMDKLPSESELRAMTPFVAIVGRLNVGKSMLFNRLLGQKRAIVARSPGTTRDRIYAEVSWERRNFTLVDTPAFGIGPDSSLGRRIKAQLEVAIEEADAIIFLVDGREGATSLDYEIAQILKRSGKPVILAVNKIDNQEKHSKRLVPFHKFEFGEPLPISAYYNKGLDRLKGELIARFPPSLPHLDKESMMKLAIVGRLNVGKSALLNALLKQERAIVEEAPGTTRDVTETVFYYIDNEPVVLIDTAGFWGRGRMADEVESRSIMQTRKAIRKADVVLLILDALVPVTPQDIAIMSYIKRAFKPTLILVNKWDLVEDPSQETMEFIRKEVRRRFKLPPNFPILFISAESGQGVEKVLPKAGEIYEERAKRIPTPLLNEELKKILAAHPPPSWKGRKLEIFYATQIGRVPPTFVFFTNDKDLVPPSYKRLLEDELHQRFGFAGVPLQLVFRNRRLGV